ncbi:hypothetical protein EWM64_g3932 [Hericium alpestre]|uniref:Aromatic-L-amino-acid decarboxylase n=1 Tax=Hericium alpestre TaxID=135208 RepID=A0A4Z0A183_9AGAM|nr:hypothetical protein EWM64_g3932 [Hericium alpestre]
MGVTGAVDVPCGNAQVCTRRSRHALVLWKIIVCLTMDIEQFRKAGYQAIDRICDYYYSLREKPVVSQVEPGYLRKALPDAAPVKGEEWQGIADDYQKLIIPGANLPFPVSMRSSSPSLMMSSSTCNPGFNWFASPACTELESVVMDWAAKMQACSQNQPLSSRQLIQYYVQTTASDSALTAIVAARARYTTANPGVPLESLIIYVTSQTHSFGKKAALILGLRVRAIDVDEDVRAGWGLDGAKLRQSVEEDREAGLHPFILVATVGTTSTGAIDRIADLGATIKENFQFLWLHVDAAWAGVTLSCPEHREKAQLAGINEYADSLCVNFHKWGLTNFDCSALWVRDRGLLVNALDVTPEYLRTKHGDAGTVIDYRNWHLSLGRRFRSLKIWFVLRSFGIEGFQSYIRRCIALSDVFAKYIQESDIFDFVAPPSFALTVFRIAPVSEPNADLAQLNDLNHAFHEALQSHHAELVLTQTEVGGVFCMRLAVGAARTEERDIVQAWTIIKEVAEDVLRRWKDGKLEPKN